MSRESSQIEEMNICLYPEIIDRILTYYMPLIPLWSGIILTTVNPASNVSTDGIASVLIYYVIISLQKFTKSPISHNSVNVQDKHMKIISQIHFKFLDTMTKVLENIQSSWDDDVTNRLH